MVTEDTCKKELLNAIAINPTLLHVDLRGIDCLKQDEFKVLVDNAKRNLNA